MTNWRSTLVLVPALALAAGCGGTDREAGPDVSTTSKSPVPAPSSAAPTAEVAAPKVVGVVATNLTVPWGIGFLPDGSALVTERDSGTVVRIVGKTVTKVGTIDETRSQGEAGLLGLAVSPEYATNHQVFVYTSTDSDNRVLRLTYADGRLGTPTAILTGIPHGFIHDGGRLAFGPDGYLYVSTGESGERELAQDRSALGGKILRITTEGKPAPGNPDPDSPVWTYGHRNVQGLAFDAGGQLWASEFGQNTWDELNKIQAGKNYGWPVVEGKASSASERKKYQDPQQVWHTEDASPSGLGFLDGYLWMGSLKGERLWRVTLDGDRAVAPKAFFVGEYGRMRTVAVAPDGRLWVTTSNRDGRGDPQRGDDRILLVDPGTS